MTHIVIHDREKGIVEARINGPIDLNELTRIYAVIVQILKENGSSLFCMDMREAEMNIATVDIFHLPRRLAEIAAREGCNPLLFRQAIVATRNLKDHDFHVIAASNLGYTIELFELFEEIEEAERWLLDK